MQVSGFSIIRNGIMYGYPFLEAIQSILPLCSEFVVNVGVSEDGTIEAIQSLGEDKIKIMNREWDMNLRTSGTLLSVETNYALRECTGDWCFYIQADELLHEKYLPIVHSEMKRFQENDKVEGFNFRYKHFYGSYDYYQDNYRKWYYREVRVIKNNHNIVSWADAMGFKHADGTKISSRNIKAEIYHYGWVRPPEVMNLKTVNLHKLYHNDEEVKRMTAEIQTYSDLGNLKIFKDSHPLIMQTRIKASKFNFDARLEEQLPDFIRKILILIHPVLKRIRNIFRKK